VQRLKLNRGRQQVALHHRRMRSEFIRLPRFGTWVSGDSAPRLKCERAGAKPVKALSVVQVDVPVSDKVLEALMSIEALLEARLVKLPEAGF
jgi:hypothetical protein